MSHPIEKLSSKYPSQDTLTKIYGCNKYQLGDKMRNNFHIDDAYLPALVTYFISHWHSPEFKYALIDGTITRKIKDSDPLTTFNVIYHNCTPFAAKRAKELRISFRAAQPEFQLEPIALVQIVDSGGE